MKKFRLFSAFMVLLSAFSFVSCEDEPQLGDGVSNTGEVSTTALTAVISGGGNYEASTTSAIVSDNSITISGTDSQSGGEISMSLNRPKVRLDRRYKSATFSITMGGIEYTSINPVTNERSGTIIISKLDSINKKISGFFSFQAWGGSSTEPIAIHNGIFEDISYTGDDLPRGLPAITAVQESIKAKISGGTLLTFPVIETELKNGIIIVLGKIAEPASQMQIAFGENIVPGEYPISDFASNGNAEGIYIVNATTYTSVEGTLIIESNEEGVVKGKFKFVAKDAEAVTTFTITEGEFNTEY